MAFKTKLPSAIEEVLRRFLKGKGYEIYLFGSRAKGTERPDSDFDLAIRGKGPVPLELWAELEEAFQESDVPQKVDLVDYHRVQPNFRTMIDSTGLHISPLLKSVRSADGESYSTQREVRF